MNIREITAARTSISRLLFGVYHTVKAALDTTGTCRAVVSNAVDAIVTGAISDVIVLTGDEVEDIIFER